MRSDAASMRRLMLRRPSSARASWYEDCAVRIENSEEVQSGREVLITGIVTVFSFMGNTYSTWYRESVGAIAHPAKYISRLNRSAESSKAHAIHIASGLQTARVVLIATVVLLLSFSAVLKLSDMAGVHAFWLEIGLALVELAVLAASYLLPFVQRVFGQIVRLFCYVTAGVFILLAAANGFTSNYAFGLLFVIPGLGAGYGIATRAVGSLATFLFVTATGAAAASLATAGAGGSTALFISSLVCLSLVTLFVANGWLDARKRCLASEERYRAIVEQASDGIFMLDANTLKILDANPAFCRMVGASHLELKNIHVADFLESERGCSIGPEAFSDGRSSQLECIVRRRDATSVFGDLKVDRIRHNDGDVLSVVVHDITSRKEYEERLLRARDAAEEIARFKSALLANMSHEIRTPLSSILGWTSVLGSEVPDRHRELVHLIECSGKRLHNTLDSVLELAHLQANTKELTHVRFDVNKVVRQTVDLLRHDATEKGLELDVSVPEDPAWLESDPACLRRILLHVLDNAVKFTESGHVAVSVRRTSGELALTVNDTGVGISPEFLAVAFDEFKQESEGLNRAHEGSGLGLSLVRRLTELLDGRVHVESKQGVGTTLTVYLPNTSRSRRHACA